MFWRPLVLILFLGGSTVLNAEPPVRLIPVNEERELYGMLPTVSSGTLGRRVLSSDDLIWYTDREMPPAYQLQNTFHSPFYNVSNENERDLSGRLIGKDRVGNGNRDFPWVTTAGTDHCPDVEIFRFMQLPRNPSGKHYPVVYFHGPNPGSNLVAFQGARTTLGEGGGAASVQRWMFPIGTTFGELMCQHGPEDMLYPFEVRLRFREKEYWEVDVYRPYTTAKDLSNAVKELRPEWWQDDELVKLLSSLKSPKVMEGSIRDNNRNRTAFQSKFKKHELPPISDQKLIAELLTTAEWKSAQGTEWVEGVSVPTAAKGSKFHIVPADYSAHMLEVNSESCNRCHEHTGFNCRTFDANRGWYGRIRGNDKILSFHPIATSAISYDGRNKEVQLRKEFVDAGVVESYDPKKHLSDRYSQLRPVQ